MLNWFEIASINKDIEILETKIDNIESDYIDKEILELKLDNLKKDLNLSLSGNTSDIELQLKDIENRIEDLEK